MGVVTWIKEGSEEGCGEQLLREVRYGLIQASRLAEVGLTAKEMLAGCRGVLLRDLALNVSAVQQVTAQKR